MSDQIRVLLADDHDLAREGLNRILKMAPGIEVVGQATNGEDAVIQAEALSPDVILMDIKMPQMNGIEATRIIRRKNLESAIIFMSFYDEFVAEAIDVGASGYLTKDVSGDRLVMAIRDVYAGGRVLDVSSMTKTALVDDWLTKPVADVEPKAAAQPLPSSTNTSEPESTQPVLVSRNIPVDLAVPPSSNSAMVLQLLDNLGQQLKAVILEVGGSPTTGTVVKVLVNNPASFRDELLRLEQVSAVSASSDGPVHTSTEESAEEHVTQTFYVELNDPADREPLHLAEWPNPAWSNASKKPPQKTPVQKGWLWAS